MASRTKISVIQMKTYDNNGKLVGEITQIIRPGFGVITTNTTYGRDERPLHQTISSDVARFASAVGFRVIGFKGSD